jgi:hypothetical protein
MEDKALEILKMQHQALREEFMEKLRSSYRLGQNKVIAIGAILGAAIAEDTGTVTYFDSIMVVAMLLPMAFDAAMHFNGRCMIMIGKYVRTHLEPGLKRCDSSLSGQILWEEFVVAGEHGGRKPWSLFEVVQPALTIALQVLIIFRLPAADTGLAVIGWIAVGLEVALVVAIVNQK